jgi:hypothetical protein
MITVDLFPFRKGPQKEMVGSTRSAARLLFRGPPPCSFRLFGGNTLPLPDLRARCCTGRALTGRGNGGARKVETAKEDAPVACRSAKAVPEKASTEPSPSAVPDKPSSVGHEGRPGCPVVIVAPHNVFNILSNSSVVPVFIDASVDLDKPRCPRGVSWCTAMGGYRAAPRRSWRA